MEIEKQVTSLELSKILDALIRTVQNSFWSWYPTQRNDHAYSLRASSLVKGKMKERSVPAYTVSELGELLPRFIDKYNLIFVLYPDEGKSGVSYYNVSVGRLNTIPTIEGNTEANARAKMLIYLIENKLHEVV